jgi:hypothetical protein
MTPHEVADKLTEAQRILWIRTVLVVTHSEPQRRAFVAGYNGLPMPGKPSDQMWRDHRLGNEVSRILQERAND